MEGSESISSWMHAHDFTLDEIQEIEKYASRMIDLFDADDEDLEKVFRSLPVDFKTKIFNLLGRKALTAEAIPKKRILETKKRKPRKKRKKITKEKNASKYSIIADLKTQSNKLRKKAAASPQPNGIVGEHVLIPCSSTGSKGHFDEYQIKKLEATYLRIVIDDKIIIVSDTHLRHAPDDVDAVNTDILVHGATLIYLTPNNNEMKHCRFLGSEKFWVTRYDPDNDEDDEDIMLVARSACKLV